MSRSGTVGCSHIRCHADASVTQRTAARRLTLPSSRCEWCQLAHTITYCDVLLTQATRMAYFNYGLYTCGASLKKRSHFFPSQALDGVLTGSGYHAAHEEMVGSALPMRSCHRHLPGDSPMLVRLAMVATQRHLSQLTRGPPRRTRNLVCRAHVACVWW